MGTICCKRVGTHTTIGQLELQNSVYCITSLLHLVASFSAESALKGAATLSSNKTKNPTRKESEVDKIAITSKQFILENKGILSENYEFIKKLGQGTYGVVYKAIQKKSKELRAIKVITRTESAKERELAIKNEIRVLKEMDHPSIMRIYEFASDESFYYLVSE